MKYVYLITMTYTENKNHNIVETWRCSGDNKFKKTLIESLDLLVNKDGFVLRPDIESLKRNLSKYADYETIKNEFNRLKKAYKCYVDIMSNLLEVSVGTYTSKLDRNTSYNIVKIY